MLEVMVCLNVQVDNH